MCDLFSLDYGGPNFNTTKRENRNGMQFVHGEHANIFEVWPKSTKTPRMLMELLVLCQ